MLFQAHFTCDCWSLDHQSFTPDGKSIATVLNDFKVEIRDSSTGNLLSTLRCIDKIDQIKWSPNGRHILAAMYERNAVHVFTPPTHPTQASARVDGGELGVDFAGWSPNSQDLIVFGRYGIRADVWELRTSKLTGIPLVKDSRKGFAFSPNKCVLAYLTRREGKDCLALHSVEDWCPLTAIDLATLDARELAWSPDGVFVAIADCEIEHRIVVVNSETGAASTFEGYTGEKGATKICWCINSHLLAVGSGNDAVQILFTPDWKLLTEFHHIRLSRAENAEHWEEETPGRMIRAEKVQPKGFDARVCGINRLEWSKSGRFIASATASHVKTLFIWDMETLMLRTVFSFLSPIADAKWSPTDDLLAIGIGTDKLITWRPSGFKVSQAQEAAIQIHLVVWRSDGECVACFDTVAGTATLAFVLKDEEQ
jgi:WD40 repeat protein